VGLRPSVGGYWRGLVEAVPRFVFKAVDEDVGASAVFVRGAPIVLIGVPVVRGAMRRGLESESNIAGDFREVSS